ncbi:MULTISPECIES: MFS transporter [unclassified Gilliamella]|uniref:MFS transporter n=1 Tax=unclassified Gilliamella TaxID=2685620 RepID=UPI001C6A4386|nr:MULTISPECIES: MFS transporter [unclassified Gilliamella]MCX8600709.1 MFS transporter [Gilliamella sp. B3722]MCX8609249.1 MFS transporter [Gilliamella sp. B3771]MCX8609926.1 MFS transporter [Gilliamella sp. B3891]MCX8611984.1 MFS transporter [Gilliamella sp. B3773]MCX8615488.1 MFS transporter [Gilliamella sp. B3770]
MSSIPSFRQRQGVIFSAFLFATFVIGVAGALQSPTLSRFLSVDVNVDPRLVGLFFSVNAFASIIGSFLLAKYSDKRGDRRNIVIFCCLMGVANSLIFAFSRNYYLLITLGVLFAALSSAAMPQIFALAREYAVKSGRNVVAFNSLIRAQLSLAWVIGPPLSFGLAIEYGFTTMYLSAMSMFIVAMIFVAIFLPSVEKNPTSELPNNVDLQAANQPLFKNKNVVFLLLSTVFMWTANMMYIIDMPLYVQSVLHLSDSLPGYLMGLAAGIEIPVMIIAGYLVPMLGKRNLFFIAIICGLIFYIGMILFTDEWILFVLQLFNALFIGIVANIGIIYFQDLLPTRMGVASTLFNNGIICSIIIAGMLQGFVSESYGHEIIYSIALIMVAISLIFCALVKEVRTKVD